MKTNIDVTGCALDHLVWSYEHDAWWGPNQRGYTSRILEAGLYTKAQADEIVEGANYGAHICEKVVPFAEHESFLRSLHGKKNGPHAKDRADNTLGDDGLAQWQEIDEGERAEQRRIDRADAAPAASLIPAAEIDAIGALIEEADRTARWLSDNAWKMDGLNQNVAKQMRIRATALEAAKRAVTVRA